MGTIFKWDNNQQGLCIQLYFLKLRNRIYPETIEDDRLFKEKDGLHAVDYRLIWTECSETSPPIFKGNRKSQQLISCVQCIHLLQNNKKCSSLAFSLALKPVISNHESSTQTILQPFGKLRPPDTY